MYVTASEKENEKGIEKKHVSKQWQVVFVGFFGLEGIRDMGYSLVM